MNVFGLLVRLSGRRSVLPSGRPAIGLTNQPTDHHSDGRPNHFAPVLASVHPFRKISWNFAGNAWENGLEISMLVCPDHLWTYKNMDTICWFSSIWRHFWLKWNWSNASFPGLFLITDGGGGIFSTLCIEFCLVLLYSTCCSFLGTPVKHICTYFTLMVILLTRNNVKLI